MGSRDVVQSEKVILREDHRSFWVERRFWVEESSRSATLCSQFKASGFIMSHRDVFVISWKSIDAASRIAKLLVIKKFSGFQVARDCQATGLGLGAIFKILPPQ